MDKSKVINGVFQSPLYTSVELMLSPECNLQCAYCYMKRHNKSNKSPKMSKEVIDKTIQVFKDHKQGSFRIELFGGEPLLQLDLVEYVAQITKDDPQIESITMPTNGYVVCSDYDTIINLLRNYPKIFLSLSVDGPYADPIQRPPREDYAHLKLDYDKLFSLFYETLRCGFHPMVYAETVQYLYQTFVFFVEHLSQSPTPIGDVLYLLQVRNGGTWTDERIDTLISESKKCLEYIKEHNINPGESKFNMFQGHHTITRGLTCSLQTTLDVDWNGDIYPCHRLIYPQFYIGSIFDFDNLDVSKFAFFQYYHRHNNLVCQECKFAPSQLHYCTGGCLGAQYEYWKDPFIPIPDVCQMLKRFEAEVSDVINW